jgi:pullulanase
MFYMANRLGAWETDGSLTEGKVSFKLFFPKGPDPEISSIKVAGDFQHLVTGGADWDFLNGLPLERNDTEKGTFWTCVTEKSLPAGYYQYKYFIQYPDGVTRKVSDPCARYGGVDNQNAAFVIGGSRPSENEVRRLENRKHLRDLIIYEMHVDDFTDEYRGVRAPLDAVVDKLDYLCSLNFNAILFMPWTAWKHIDFDWGYEPFQYFTVDYRLANDLDKPAEKISWLKKLISECHARGIHVIMDGVFNHVSVDFPYKHMYRDHQKCPYTGDFGGTFPGLQDLDFHNSCTQEFIRDVCLYWIDIFRIDGIRFDNTVNFNVPGDHRGLAQLLGDLQGHLDQRGEKNFSLTLEHLSLDAANVTNNTKATSYWDNALYERTFGYLWNGYVDQRFLNCLNNRRYLESQDKVPTTYLGNHDHSHVTWQAGARTNEGSMKWFKTQPYAIALYASSCTPMVQNGQEYGEEHWIPEDDHGTGRRIRPRPLRWKAPDDNIGKPLLKLYRRMGELRANYSALSGGDFNPDRWEEWQTRLSPDGVGIDTEKQVAVFHRSGRGQEGNLQYFIVVLNFSDSDQYVTVKFPENGEWVDLLSNYVGSWRPQIQNNSMNLTVTSNWGHVFFKNLGG